MWLHGDIQGDEQYSRLIHGLGKNESDNNSLTRSTIVSCMVTDRAGSSYCRCPTVCSSCLRYGKGDDINEYLVAGIQPDPCLVFSVVSSGLVLE